MNHTIAVAFAVGIALAAAACTTHIEQRTESSEIDLRTSALDAFARDVGDVDRTDSDAVRAALWWIEKKRNVWEGTSIEAAVRETREELQKTRDRLQSAAPPVARRLTIAPESSNLTELRERLAKIGDVYTPEVAGANDDIKVEVALAKIEHVFVGKMREETKTTAADSTPHQGLARYARAED